MTEKKICPLRMIGNTTPGMFTGRECIGDACAWHYTGKHLGREYHQCSIQKIAENGD